MNYWKIKSLNDYKSKFSALYFVFILNINVMGDGDKI